MMSVPAFLHRFLRLRTVACGFWKKYLPRQRNPRKECTLTQRSWNLAMICDRVGRRMRPAMPKSIEQLALDFFVGGGLTTMMTSHAESARRSEHSNERRFPVIVCVCVCCSVPPRCVAVLLKCCTPVARLLPAEAVLSALRGTEDMDINQARIASSIACANQSHLLPSLFFFNSKYIEQIPTKKTRIRRNWALLYALQL